jgi:hypothetical protein
MLTIMLSLVLLSVVMLSDTILSVDMVSPIILSVAKLCVMLPNQASNTI